MYGFTTLTASGCTVLVMPKEFKYLLHVGEIQCVVVMCRWQEHMIVDHCCIMLYYYDCLQCSANYMVVETSKPHVDLTLHDNDSVQ